MNAVEGAMAAQRTVRTHALSLAAAVIVLVCGALGLSSLWPMLDDAWSNIYGAFSHGYLVLALCVWLGVRYWRTDPPAELRAAWLAVIPLLALMVALVALEAMYINSTRLSLLPLIFLAAVAATFGWPAARSLLWPSLFLYFALPQWWAINGALQSLTSAVVSTLVNLTGLSAYVEGNFIHVPAGVFEIASGCSGLNYLVAALSLAGFYALMYLRRWKSRAVLLAAAAAAAMVSNFARIYALIVIGIVTEMQHYLIRVEHLYFGWVLFMLSMAPVLLLARRLDDADSTATAANVIETSRTTTGATRSVLPAAVVAGLVLTLPQVVTVQARGDSAQMQALPATLGSWQRATPTSAWQPAFVNAQAERTQYVKQSQSIELFRAMYAHQTSDARVIRTDNDFFGPGWRPAEQELVELDAAVPEVLETRGYLQERERLIWSWYVVAGRSSATKLRAKLLEVRGLIDRRRDAAGLAIAADCVPDCAAARARLTSFMQESAASLP